MISVTEAKKIIQKEVALLSPVRLPLQQAAGLVLAEDVHATIDVPAFDQSSMDGYAFCYQNEMLDHRFWIKGEIPAGTTDVPSVEPQEALRIFTGAALPRGADTVVMQEKVAVENGELIVLDEQLQRGGNVRPKGSEIKAGELALAKESFLSPAAVGFLAGIGTSEVTVFPRPSVSIVVTGNELQQPGQLLRYGQVYESNSFTLKAALQRLGVAEVSVFQVGDHLLSTKETLEKALHTSDLILITGGVSVGDYDFVSGAAAACGVTCLFHKVKQRPGKPLYFGKIGQRLVFGLPGNPSSVLSCFYQYVVQAFERLTGQKNILSVVQAPLAKGYQKKVGLTYFLKGLYQQGTALPLDAQESYRLRSFATANCLVCLEEDREEYKEGDIVEAHLLPY